MSCLGGVGLRFRDLRLGFGGFLGFRFRIFGFGFSGLGLGFQGFRLSG